ncbi:MAG: bifunctional oligoribonuclease/PAP phosphatase NrnA [Candidatus Omnitrophota bacterium]
MSKEKVIRAFRRYRRFIVTSHVNMEGDSVGSQVAVAWMLRKMGKECVILHKQAPPEGLRFLIKKDKFRSAISGNKAFDAIVAVDCPVIQRMGISYKKLKKAVKCVINIDHHVSNAGFGDINWIAPETSSCGEMMFRLFRAAKMDFDVDAALAMYVAILTDTGSFGYEATTAATHTVVAQLIKKGVSPLNAKQRLDEAKSMGDIKLLISTLDSLRLHFGGKVATMHTSQKMLRRFRLPPEKTENFVNFARSIKTAEVALFFLEKPGPDREVHVSIRSKGKVNVNRLAGLFGGGGHRNAAGCVIKGSIPYARKLILSKAGKFLKR